MTQQIIPNFMRKSHKGKRAAKATEIWVDNFAGGGGASTGIEKALGRAVDVAINHDPKAITMHIANHPTTLHLCEDVWDVDPMDVAKGRPVAGAWFSPDCKHHSRARGCKPVNKRIRGLAWVAVKWAKTVKPARIFLENVREFQDWGPVIHQVKDAVKQFHEDGSPKMVPDPARKGETFKRFIGMLRKLGYQVEHRVLNAADYGAPTHRRRFFLIARYDGAAIVWPEPTHGPKLGLKPYRTAACCIDWSIPCPSIFTRKKPLAEKTLRRIAMGLKRYVFENPHPFIVNVQHGGEEFRGQEMNRPLGTVTQKHGYGVVTPFLAECANSNWSQGHRAADVPAPTITSNPKGGSWALVSPFVSAYHDSKNDESRCADPRNPLNTLDTSNRYAAVAAFLSAHYGEAAHQETRGQKIDEPIRTVTPANNTGVLVSAFVAGVGGRAGQTPPTAADAPVGTITAKNDRAIVATHLTKFYGTATGSDMREPMPTVTADAGGGHLGEVRAFLLKYYGLGAGQPCDESLHTVTTKDRFGLVTIHGQDYQIVDIGLRMLTPRELLRAQFSPELAEDYVLPKSNAEAVAKIGNSVCPLAAYALVKANIPAGVPA